MVESAAHLVDHVFPVAPVRQFVLTFPFPLRFLLAAQLRVLSEALAVVQCGISTFIVRRPGFTVASGARTDAVTLIQRFGSALNLNPHLGSGILGEGCPGTLYFRSMEIPLRTLILYYQPECHLCEDAEVLLHAAGQGNAYRKVDISGVPELLMRYEIHVPVLQRESDGRELYWPFKQRDLEVFVQRARNSA